VNQPRNKPYHHGNLAPALVAAAAEMLETEGAKAVNLRELARRAGVSAPAVYRHFAHKDALLAAVAAQGFAALVAEFERAQADNPVPLDALRALGQAYMAFAHDHPHLHALMFGPPVPGVAPLDDGEKSFRILAETVGACLGETATPERTLNGAIALWSLVHGYATLRRDGQLAQLPLAALPDPVQIITSLSLHV
jgi:AcrR family transcriptional regulator